MSRDEVSNTEQKKPSAYDKYDKPKDIPEEKKDSKLEEEEEDLVIEFIPFTTETWKKQCEDEERDRIKSEERKESAGEAHLIDGELRFETGVDPDSHKERNSELKEGCVIPEWVDEISKELCSVPLQEIDKNIKDKVRKMLCILIQHNLVIYEKNKRGFLEYRMAVEPTLWQCRFPKYIYCAKTLYGDAAELLVEEMLHHGQVLMNDVVQRVTDRLNEVLRESGNAGHPEISARVVYDKFCSLARTHFIMRCTTISTETENSASQAPDNEHSQYEVPSMDVDGDGRVKRKRSLDKSDQPVKRQKTGDTTSKEDGIFWRVNFDRFHQHFRDQAIVAAIASKVDKKASEVLRTMLRISEVKSASHAPVTVPVSFTEILQALPKEAGLTRNVTEQYLALLSEDSTEIVSKVGNSGGGMYSVNIYKGLISLCKAHVESVVQERFGSKSLRIFRLLLLRKHLEQKQIEDLAMVPATEANEILYRMFAQRFVSITEISKTPDHALSRTFYLFTVNLQQVARMLIQKCYQAMANALIKKEAEVMDHRRLLDKQERVDAITTTLEQTGADEAQKEEVEQMITPAEKTQLNQVKETRNKLDQAELQLDDTIFILETFLFYTEQETCVS